MTRLLTGFWPTTELLPSEERARSHRLALAEARTASEPRRPVEAGSPVAKLLVTFWRRSPSTKRAAA